ncbi:MAG TPA: hypothetical protein VFG67_01715, partial [Oleiagrimonas sp.]|nr:hypothetical protein [Oleiagrimonas sp.]
LAIVEDLPQASNNREQARSYREQVAFRCGESEAFGGKGHLINLKVQLQFAPHPPGELLWQEQNHPHPGLPLEGEGDKQ